MAELGPIKEEALGVSPSAFLGPGIGGPLEVLANTFLGPILEGQVDVSEVTEDLLMEVFDGEAHPSPSAVSVQEEGATVGAEQTISFDSSPGISIVGVEDAVNDRNDLTMSFDGMRLLAQVINIDAQAVAETPLYTVPGGQTLIVEAVVLRCTSASGITAPPSAGVGQNAGADDIFESQIMTGLTQQGLAYLFPQGGTQVEVAAGQVVSLGIDVAAVGTSMTLAADLIGRLI